VKSRIMTIAHYTVLEAVRTRLPLLTIVIICTIFTASLFVREIAIIEAVRFQAASYAAIMRLAIVFVAVLYAIASIAREFQDKGLDVALALDLPRSHYIIGKLAGLLVISFALAWTVSIPLIPLAGLEAAAAWAISLAFELAVVVAMSVFCVVTFSQLMPAASLVIAFYLFARALNAIRLVSAHPIADAHTLSHQFMAGLVEGLALIVPALDGWTRTVWLVEGAATAWSALAIIGLHSALFVTVLAGAAVFDMHRRNF
jgi:ABC-type transport system involved in multi-copper enzyme maturation permease subunit